MVNVFLSVIYKTPLTEFFAITHSIKFRAYYNSSAFCGNNRRTAVLALITPKIAAKEPITQLPLKRSPNAMMNVKMETAAMMKERQPTPARLAPSGALFPFVEEMFWIFSRQPAIATAPLFHPITERL
jgi:hypothetical protein